MGSCYRSGLLANKFQVNFLTSVRLNRDGPAKDHPAFSTADRPATRQGVRRRRDAGVGHMEIIDAATDLDPKTQKDCHASFDILT
jgi:hypothetical protein